MVNKKDKSHRQGKRECYRIPIFRLLQSHKMKEKVKRTLLDTNMILNRSRRIPSLRQLKKWVQNFIKFK